MPFLTVRKILNKVETFHEEFARRLDAAADTAQNEEAKMMLGFLRDHQRRLCTLLANIEKDSPETLSSLNEWMQFDSQIEDPEAYLDQFRVEPDATPAQVLEAANRLDICLFCIYRALASGGSTPKAQRLFARLARLELDHQKSRGGSGSYY